MEGNSVRLIESQILHLKVKINYFIINNNFIIKLINLYFALTSYYSNFGDNCSSEVVVSM